MAEFSAVNDSAAFFVTTFAKRRRFVRDPHTIGSLSHVFLPILRRLTPKTEYTGVDTWLSAGALNTYPIWSPGGREIAFATAIKRPWDIYRMSTDGGSDPEPVMIDTPNRIPLVWSADEVSQRGIDTLSMTFAHLSSTLFVQYR